MNATSPSDETKARFAELARKYERKLPRKFAEMIPFKEWIQELRAKGASCDDIRILLADVNVKVANDTVHRFCRDMLGNCRRRERKKSQDTAARQPGNGSFPSTGYGASDQTANNQVFDVSSYIWSAMEHGIIEQLQNSNLVAASTVKMLQIANTNSQAIYMARAAPIGMLALIFEEALLITTPRR